MSPPARASAGPADGPGGGLILFGGTTPGGLLGDTWLWNGTTWAELNPTPTPAACGAKMVCAHGVGGDRAAPRRERYGVGLARTEPAGDAVT